MKTSLPCFTRPFKWGWHLQVRFLSCHHSYANSGEKQNKTQQAALGLFSPAALYNLDQCQIRLNTLFPPWWWFSQSCDFRPLSSVGGDCTLNKRWMWMSSTSSGHGKKKKTTKKKQQHCSLHGSSSLGAAFIPRPSRREDSGSWRGSLLLRRGHKFRSCFASSSEM